MTRLYRGMMVSFEMTYFCAYDLIISPLQKVLLDDISLPGGFCVWLTKTKRAWLSGRFLVSGWDVAELESQREIIVAEDKFKFRLKI